MEIKTKLKVTFVFDYTFDPDWYEGETDPVKNWKMDLDTDGAAVLLSIETEPEVEELHE